METGTETLSKEQEEAIKFLLSTGKVIRVKLSDSTLTYKGKPIIPQLTEALKVLEFDGLKEEYKQQFLDGVDKFLNAFFIEDVFGFRGYDRKNFKNQFQKENKVAYEMYHFGKFSWNKMKGMSRLYGAFFRDGVPQNFRKRLDKKMGRLEYLLGSYKESEDYDFKYDTVRAAEEYLQELIAALITQAEMEN